MPTCNVVFLTAFVSVPQEESKYYQHNSDDSQRDERGRQHFMWSEKCLWRWFSFLEDVFELKQETQWGEYRDKHATKRLSVQICVEGGDRDIR